MAAGGNIAGSGRAVAVAVAAVIVQEEVGIGTDRMMPVADSYSTT